jgi:hypothetical protein
VTNPWKKFNLAPVRLDYQSSMLMRLIMVLFLTFSTWVKTPMGLLLLSFFTPELGEDNTPAIATTHKGIVVTGDDYPFTPSYSDGVLANGIGFKARDRDIRKYWFEPNRQSMHRF